VKVPVTETDQVEVEGVPELLKLIEGVIVPGSSLATGVE
jgi:hypothetical protein